MEARSGVLDLHARKSFIGAGRMPETRPTFAHAGWRHPAWLGGHDSRFRSNGKAALWANGPGKSAVSVLITNEGQSWLPIDASSMKVSSN
jgi:hypothetical protein